jgi:hypothetical protein
MALPIPGGWGLGLLFGFSQGMLGVTGFETAANYIEEQRKGVYVKTLRNMYVGRSLVQINCLTPFACGGLSSSSIQSFLLCASARCRSLRSSTDPTT